MKGIDLAGSKIGIMTVMERGKGRVQPRKGRSDEMRTTWILECKCGNYLEVLQNQITRKSPSPLSCGCLKRAGRLTHGLSRHPLYIKWVGMKQRCYNVKDSSYLFYGGRGIVVCKRWKNSVANFIEDMGPTYQEGLTLDRIRNDGNYGPNNCKWSTVTEQAKNKRSSLNVKIFGGYFSLVEIANAISVPKSTVYVKYHALGLKEFRQYCRDKSKEVNKK